jgi:pimeloyl-ACP methyl ester carboxylesterase
MAARLVRSNPRLTGQQARFLAEHSSVTDEAGGRRWLFDPTHRMSLPSLHSIEEWGRIWAGIRVPVLWIASTDRRPSAPTSVPGEMERRASLMPRLQRVSIPDTGHNLQHDAPEQVADLIERFIANPKDPVARGCLDDVPLSKNQGCASTPMTEKQRTLDFEPRFLR